MIFVIALFLFLTIWQLQASLVFIKPLFDLLLISLFSKLQVIEKLICSSAPQSTSLNCTSTLSSSSSPYTNAATIGNDLRGQVQQSYIGWVKM